MSFPPMFFDGVKFENLSEVHERIRTSSSPTSSVQYQSWITDPVDPFGHKANARSIDRMLAELLRRYV